MVRAARRAVMAPPLLLGWREWIALPDLGVDRIRAKIDTGARSSAIHATGIQYFLNEGVKWVSFEAHPLATDRPGIRVQAPLIEHRMVRSSSGEGRVRPFILTTVRVGGVEFEAEFSLTDRRNLKFPMLLGRTAMRGHAYVDPASSWLLGK